MSFFREVVVPGAALVGAVLIFWLTLAKVSGSGSTALSTCAAKAETAAISQRAAQICSTELVGCSLSYEQLRGVVADARAAEVCK